MAQKVQVLLVDDLDGGEASETVSFSLDGTAYLIDLSSDNAGKLRKDIAQYIDHARKDGGSGGRRRGRARTGPGRERSAEIRAWARQQGEKVSERGRIPATIIARYEASH
jgi:nucleoid-associated protein Lsr2